MISVVEEFMRKGHGLPNRAAAELALGLMRGDPGTFKAGYSLESALVTACEVFPQADREQVRKLVVPIGGAQ